MIAPVTLAKELISRNLTTILHYKSVADLPAGQTEDAIAIDDETLTIEPDYIADCADDYVTPPYSDVNVISTADELFANTDELFANSDELFANTDEQMQLANTDEQLQLTDEDNQEQK